MKLTVYIHAEYNEWEKRHEFKVWSIDMSRTASCGPLVGTHEIDFDPPPNEVLVAGTIKEYRARQKEILAKSEMQRAELEQRINELLCLEYKPEAA